MIIGGSALPKGLARAALARGIDVFTGYGMSETCPILAIAQLTPVILERDADGQLEIRTRAGRPLPLVDLRIVDEEMRDVPVTARPRVRWWVRPRGSRRAISATAGARSSCGAAATSTRTTSRTSPRTATWGSPIASKN